MRALFAAFVCLSLSAFASDPIPADRILYPASWEGKVGVVGGIPVRSTIFTNMSTSATQGQLQHAIDICPSNQVVHLPAATYAYSGTINMDSNGGTLRGDVDVNGVPTTIIKNCSVQLGQGSGWDFGSSGSWTTTTVSSGATRGSTSMVFASTSGLTVGDLVWVHASASATVTGSNWSDLFATYPVSQVMKVTGVAGTTVTFELPFESDYWTGTIRAAWHGSGTITRMVGLENISFTPTGSGAGYNNNYIMVQGVDGGWIKNCKTYDLANNNIHHVYVYGSYRLEIRHCDMSRMRQAEGAGDASNNYCVLLSHSGAWWIEDNYFHRVPNVMPMFDSGEGAFTFNYIYDLSYGNSSPGWLSQIVFCHGSHIHYCLFEGNWIAGSYNEQGTSGSRNMLWFRNRMVGWDPNPTQGTPKDANTEAIVIADGHFNTSLAGNIMGQNGFHTVYQRATAHAGDSSDTFPSDCCIHIQNNSVASLLKTNNYNYVNDAVPAGEALAGGQSFVSSYIYSSTPTNWGANQPWPPWDTSVITAARIDPTNIPAGFRATFGFDPTPGSGGSSPVAAVTLGAGTMRVSNGSIRLSQ